jgi:putative DNA primase/helicase
MGKAALAYARRGWPVFPCSPQTKRPLVKRDLDAEGKPIAGTGGVSKATTDEDQVRAWWRQFPNAMIGVATGRNGLFVVDFDPGTDEKTGEVFTLEGLKAALEAQIGCALPPSLSVRTAGKGGVHVYFRQPSDDGGEIRNRGNLPHRIDVRGTGGYVIAPPSRMSNGREYRWLHGDADAEPVDAPAQLVDVLRSPKAGAAPQTNVGAQAPASSSPALPRADDAEEEAVRRYAMAALDNEVRKAEAAPDGGRNNTISACALALGHLIGAGALSRSVCLAALTDVARRWPNLEKTVASIESGLDKGALDPRDLSEVRANARDRADRARRWGASGHASNPPLGFGGAPANDDASFRSGSIGDDSAAGGGEEADETPRERARRRARERIEQHRRLARYNRTDLGNAERFRDRYGRDFRFSPALGWLAWDGRRWKMLSTEEKGIPGELLGAVYKMVRAIRREAWIVMQSGEYDPEKNPDGLDRIGFDERGKPKKLSALLYAWAEKSESNNRLRCVAGLVQPFLTVETDAFDRDPYAINVLNGTLRFRREVNKAGPPHKAAWKLFPHRRDDLITKLAPVEFDRDAACPIYDGIMAWAQPREDMRRYLHQWGGLNLTGEMGEQKLHFWHGGGGNGKSTIIDAWAHVAGDYSTTVGIETFLDQGVKKSGGNPTPDLARLGGVRMLRTSEPEKGAQLAEALIKLVTGGEPMAVRFLNKGFFDLRPLYKLTISGNHWLGISGTDNGIWRRVKLIPWESQIADADKDEALPEKLKGEASGIFNRLIAGLLDWLRHGLIEPESVTRATAEYRDASDPLGRFLKLCTKASAGSRVQSSRLHAVYEAWCVVAGEKAWSNKGFSKALMDKGLRKKASDGMQWLDIELIREVHDFVDGEGNARPFALPDEDELPPPAYADEPVPGFDDDELP